MIREVIIVEGRDDEAAVRRAVDAAVIVTHGYGIRAETWRLAERAYKTNGLIILTDPDHAGERIRKRLAERFPEALHAHVPREEASASGDIGIENASPGAIREALEKVRAVITEPRNEFSQEDMLQYGLVGHPGSSERRAAIGRILGIGYANGKVFLARLNHYGITRREFIQAWISYTRPER